MNAISSDIVTWNGSDKMHDIIITEMDDSGTLAKYKLAKYKLAKYKLAKPAVKGSIPSVPDSWQFDLTTQRFTHPKVRASVHQHESVNK